MGIIIGTVFCVLYVAFILVQNFAYNMMVTTDLKLGQIYKNSLLFLLIRFGHCLGLAFVVILFYIAVPFILLMSASYTTLGIFIFLYSFLVIAWVQYGISYYTGCLIDRYVAEDEEPAEENSEET